jgi:signal peptidase I
LLIRPGFGREARFTISVFVLDAWQKLVRCGVEIGQPQSDVPPPAADCPLPINPVLPVAQGRQPIAENHQLTGGSCDPLTDGQKPVAPRQKSKADHDHFSFRQFLASAILFAIIVLTIRAVAIEPFGVPTGSMAPTLLGNHKSCICPRCGCAIVVGAPNHHRGDPAAAHDVYSNAWCPNCYQGHLPLEPVPEAAGDRLLVDKSVFDFRRPRRWEVAVFRNPSDLSKPYVKRVVGLPGEAIQIREGDIYVDEKLARKSLDQCRAMRIPVFDNDFQPAEGGWKMRWRRASNDPEWPQLAKDKSLPDADEHLEGSTLKWTGRSGELDWLVYRHWLLDEQREEAIRDWFAYNGGALHQELNDVHDFFVEFDIEVGPGSGTFAVKLYDGKTTVTAEIPIVARGAPPRGVRLLGVDQMPSSNEAVHLRDAGSHHVEFAFVDRRVMLAIDHQEAFAPVDLKETLNRNAVSRPVWLGSQGLPVTVKHFRLYRDVYYSPNGRNAIYDAWPLKQDEFFMLGDNSANSEDSRYWTIPGIPERNFLGKPLLLHQPSRWGHVGNWEAQFLDWQRVRWIR